MALRDWQAALGQLVEARSSGRDPGPVLRSLEGSALSPEERAWLGGVTATPGFALTAEVPRWWRHVRVRRSATLTLRALGESADVVLRDYLRDVPCLSLFFGAEGLSFLAYVASRVARPHVRSVAEFERALLALKLSAGPGGGPPPATGAEHGPAPAAVCVAFRAPPRALLGALLSGAPLPEPEACDYPVLVAPGIPGLWRPATADEAREHGVAATPRPPPGRDEPTGLGAAPESGRAPAAARLTRRCRSPRRDSAARSARG